MLCGCENECFCNRNLMLCPVKACMTTRSKIQSFSLCSCLQKGQKSTLVFNSTFFRVLLCLSRKYFFSKLGSNLFFLGSKQVHLRSISTKMTFLHVLQRSCVNKQCTEKAINGGKQIIKPYSFT